MTIAAILLAAGRSTRFGDGDKLAAPLGAWRVIDHAARPLLALPVDLRFVVTPGGSAGLAGFVSVSAGRTDGGLGDSLAVGVGAARAAGADAVLVALGDMPFVPFDHFHEILSRWSGAESLVASIEGGRRSPPALFGAAWFERLATATGDAGARDLLARAHTVAAPPGALRDIDTRADLAAAGA